MSPIPPARDPSSQEQADVSGDESQQLLSMAVAESGTGIWDRDVQGGRIHYSAGWKAILGYAEDEIGDDIRDSYRRVHPDDLEYVKATMQAHFDGLTDAYEVEHRIRCKDGSYKWVHSRGRVVSRDAQGVALRMIGTTTDNTALHTVSERLRDTVDLITNLTNEVPGLVFQYRVPVEGPPRFSYASAGARDIYELEPDALAADARILDALIHPEDLRGYHDSLRACAATLSPWHLEYRVRLPRQGLRWRQGDARPQRMPGGGTLWHGFITDVTERKHIESELRESASTDVLTLLPNRRHFMSQLEAARARLAQMGGEHRIAVMMCDLDHFKQVNDRWGHAAGDAALRHFAATLRAGLRTTDLAGRMGGEEFAVMLRDSDLAGAEAFARRLQHRLASMPVTLESDGRATLALSIGITLMHPADDSAEAPLIRSDRALYRAKRKGRNRIEIEP
ncbi:sensor domain-containing diguanylate cyclase [Castellaniella sp. S9]|uniref:sensor domain-containing diguanylate cyclase n=1 Tax=Castellaniella sp. S9 TaxID=2993652 RepID=UPI0022B38669|nr:sensor domain-containing diguanylate cyclase [Castellaniella sp. S9]